MAGLTPDEWFSTTLIALTIGGLFKMGFDWCVAKLQAKADKVSGKKDD